MVLTLSLSKHVSSSIKMLVIASLVQSLRLASADCIADPNIEDFFLKLNNADSLPTAGSCCMQDVCGLKCPATLPKVSNGYGIAVILSILVSFTIGIATIVLVKGKSENFFVAGRSLPLWMVGLMLGAQSIDSNALLGNADLAYKYSYYDGAVIPIGLGISLILNGIFLAHHINDDLVLTLPDVFAKRYGVVVEVLVSLATVCSFLMLLAGNLVGFGAIASYVWDMDQNTSIWIAAVIIWTYTVAGGLYSVAYTDCVQGVMAWTGCTLMASWFIANEQHATGPSIGFPLYVYPDTFGDGGACDMYNGTKCHNSDACCYNIAQWCPSYLNDNTSYDCLRFDRGAYPFGDHAVYKTEMSSYKALSPFPNSILWNWATIFILGIGNLGALDFQGRCIAAKGPNVARIGCIIGGLFTFMIGIPFAYLGSITRVYYGPDSIYGEFEADSCSVILGLPTCAEWLPDPTAFIKLVAHQAPPVLGGWCFIAIVAASMSTASGAILAMGTVMSHNVARQFSRWVPAFGAPNRLLMLTRALTVPFTLISTCIATFYRQNHPAGATGYLLIVAFDIVFGTVVVPLFGCFYAKNPSPRAALIAFIGGASTRIILEFALPKDGFLVLPYDSPEFLDYGTAASTAAPLFLDVPKADIWDPNTDHCLQDRFEDFTGVDSIAGFLVCLILFLSVQTLEHYKGRALFNYPGQEGYSKIVSEEPEVAKSTVNDTTKHVGVSNDFDDISHSSDDMTPKPVTEDVAENGVYNDGVAGNNTFDDEIGGPNTTIKA